MRRSPPSEAPIWTADRRHVTVPWWVGKNGSFWTMDRFCGHPASYRHGRWGALAALWAIALILSPDVVHAESASDREYKVKAAFVHNFLKFVEGGRFTPAQENQGGRPDPNDAIIVGILGAPPSRAAFEEFKNKTVGNRPLRVRWFKGFEELKDEEKGIPGQHPEIEAIRKCHVLFFCPSEKPFLPRILPHLGDHGILTVGDVPTFLEAGGVINLLVEGKKVRFEINRAAARRAKLVIRSSVLRLAVRTIEYDQLEPKKSEEQSGETGRS